MLGMRVLIRRTRVPNLHGTRGICSGGVFEVAAVRDGNRERLRGHFLSYCTHVCGARAYAPLSRSRL